MQIRAGYDIAFKCVQETPMVLMLSIEPARVADLLSEHRIKFSPDVESQLEFAFSLEEFKPCVYGQGQRNEHRRLFGLASGTRGIGVYV